jgi:hypothetical protein
VSYLPLTEGGFRVSDALARKIRTLSSTQVSLEAHPTQPSLTSPLSREPRRGLL